jgi:hypothetical protein
MDCFQALHFFYFSKISLLGKTEISKKHKFFLKKSPVLSDIAQILKRTKLAQNRRGSLAICRLVVGMDHQECSNDVLDVRKRLLAVP